eukprot:TRINITY_DN788_c0_g1_i2.p1 TRINITY_DN788_c0_g1~~TRINITY_DN788_c0_g1_i2.p1  ORF type:complete len:127 (-),score=22.15 TRINITY_DN788_c0_g1_i2:186-566(-)
MAAMASVCLLEASMGHRAADLKQASKISSSSELSREFVSFTCFDVTNYPSSSLSNNLIVWCGRGDKRTAKGKRVRGSFGNCRPKARTGRSTLGLPLTPLPPGPPRKKEEENVEYVHIEIDETLFSS